jgi:hypothetical protein
MVSQLILLPLSLDCPLKKPFFYNYLGKEPVFYNDLGKEPVFYNDLGI